MTIMEAKEDDTPNFLRLRLPTFRRIHSTDSAGSIRSVKIVRQFWPLICFLRIFGFYPISKERESTPSSTEPEEPFTEPEEVPTVSGKFCRRKQAENETGIRKKQFYKGCYFNWKKKITCYSYFITALNFFCWLIFICNIGLDIPFPLDLARMNEGTHNSTSSSLSAEHSRSRVVILVEGAIKFLEMFHLMVNSSLFTDWLNNWTDFEHDFNKYFGQKDIKFHFDMREFRTRFLIFYSLLPSLVRLGMSMYENVHYWHNPDYIVLSYFVFIWIEILLVVHSLLEDTKTILMFRSLRIVFQQVRRAINEDCNMTIKLSEQDVSEWRRLVHSTRKQVKLCSDYIKGRQLLILADTILIFTEGIYILLQAYRHDHISLFVIISNAVICILCYLRLYFTVLFAERIYSEEQQLAQDLQEIPLEGIVDSAATLEMKYLHSTIAHTPATINLGNYVDVNKKLVPKIALYVLLVLIAVLVFNNETNNAHNSPSVDS